MTPHRAMARRGAWAGLALAVLAPFGASAQGTDDEATSKGAAVGRPDASVLATTMLPFTTTPSGGLTYAVVTSGFDGARHVAIYNAYADAKIYGGLSVRAGYASPDLSGGASAAFGPRMQLLEQHRHGVDLGVALFYMPQNIYGEGLITGKVSLARAFGAVRLLGHVAYGQDPEGDDHQAEGAAAMMFRVSDALFVGVDGRARALVGSSDAKHTGLREPVFDLAAGPLATYRVGMFALMAQVGASVLWMDQRVLPVIGTTKGAYGLFGASLTL
jgi:hypothetical protein